MNSHTEPERTTSRTCPDEEPPLPDWLERTHDVLRTRARKDDGALTRERATRAILANGDVAEGSADAEHALDRRLESGRLHEVGGGLRITDPHEHERYSRGLTGAIYSFFQESPSRHCQ